MVCKEDVVTWFKELTSSKRIDVMCSLLNMCLPFELRFLGTCLEDLGKRDFHALRETENRANNSAEFAELQCISDKRTRSKLALYLSLLKSCNHACSNVLYKILANLDNNEINTILNSSSEENALDELLLLYTLALNHPAFSYEQKSVFGSILVKLQDEENKLLAKHPLGISLLYVKPPMQQCPPCPSAEERQPQDVTVLGHCPGITIPPTPSAAGDGNKGRSSIPPGLGVPPGLGLSPEQLTATSYVHVAFSSPGHQTLPAVPWHSGMSPLVMTGLCGSLPAEVQGAGDVSSYPTSPLVSRQSSPSQSGSPSRAGSPTRIQQQPLQPPPTAPAPPPVMVSERNQNFPKNMAPVRRGDRSGSHPSSGLKQNSVDISVTLPSTQHRNISRKSSMETQETFRETLVKEMPAYQNLQKYRIEELHRMNDEELKELGLSSGAVNQLRSIVTKVNNTNGLCGTDRRELAPAPSTGRRKLESTAETEQAPERKTQSAGPVMRRYPSMPLESGAAMMFPPPPPPQLLTTPQGAPCYTCIALPVTSSAAPARYHGQTQHFYCMNHHMRSLRIDGDTSRQCSNSSSASDSSSTGHSPPDTPSMPNAPHWDNRVYMGKEAVSGERWSPGCEERSEKDRRLPESTEKTGVGMEEGGNVVQHQPVQNSANNSSSSRPRLPGGLGRSKPNPPGMQTLPRGRGPNPSTVILEGNQKTLPSCRRDGPTVNGAQVTAPPPRSSHPSHEERKMFLVPADMVPVTPHANVTYTSVNSTSQPPPPQYSGSSSGSNPPPRPGDMVGGNNNVPYTPATAYLPHAHFQTLRSAASIFPGFPHGSYIRPTYPFPNGELVYQYHGPQTPPPPPPTQFIPTPVVTYSTVVPPPKVSCYNCGSQNHFACDCTDSTMEEMTKQGQYRLDYTSYPKTGECSSEK